MKSLRTALFMFGLCALIVVFAERLANAQTPDPLRCTGYPERRIFLQSQAYWERTVGKSGTDFGSVTEGTCFPVGGTLTGSTRFDIFVTMHDSPGTLTTVEIQLFGKSSGKIVAKAASPNQKCSGTCTYPFTLYANTALYPLDGLQEFRFHARIKEPDGKELMATTGWQAYLKNGHTVSNYRPQGVNFQEARGWYTGEGYTTGRFTSPMPWNAISGTWVVQVAAVKGSGGRTVGSHIISVDACPTCLPESDGKVLESGSGEYRSSVSIDTTKLANGLHTLWIKASAPSPTGSTLSGAEVIPFYVQN